MVGVGVVIFLGAQGWGSRCPQGMPGRVIQRGLVVLVPRRGRGRKRPHHRHGAPRTLAPAWQGVALGNRDVARPQGRGRALQQLYPPWSVGRVRVADGRWPARSRAGVRDACSSGTLGPDILDFVIDPALVLSSLSGRILGLGPDAVAAMQIVENVWLRQNDTSSAKPTWRSLTIIG